MGSCRFAFAVHILAVLAYKRGEEVTSDSLAGSINTNPVVVRRLLGDLRRGELIVTQKGAGRGTKLSRSPEAISLAEVYRAVSQAPSFSHHPQPPNPCCPVGRKIEEVLGQVFTSAQEALEQALARRTLAEVLETVTDDESAAHAQPFS